MVQVVSQAVPEIGYVRRRPERTRADPGLFPQPADGRSAT